MGEVWEATQEKPVRRTVALKVIKWGMDTQQVVARFESERQALALMNHATIAKVFDAGATPRGRPYFVMECVKGVPITEYCDTHRLAMQERLELFSEVCRGVQHAHQRGIIHRDIKPSSVLVSVEEGKPIPKIIDFGVAKATTQRLTEQTVHTEFGQLIGTPEYASPEQAEMTGLDIDTRTDVCSLGVLLYELLTGTRPFHSRELRQAGLLGLRQKIREQEPDKPSTRISRLGQTWTEEGASSGTDKEVISCAPASSLLIDVATQRKTDPPSLRRLLKGDLDWIVMRAIEKDRTRRYETASELAADVNRHLRHEPVTASPPSTVYRIKKFVRRHRLGVGAAALVALATLLGLVGTTAEWMRASRAEQVATREAETSQQVTDFLVRLFEVSDPSQARGEEITAREILDRGAERVEQDLAGQPAVQARLLQTVGDVYRGLGLWRPSAPLFEKAAIIRQKIFGPENLQVAESLNRLGAAKVLLGELDQAEQTLQIALDLRERLLGRNDPLVGETLRNLANLKRERSEMKEAEQLYQRVVSIQEASLGPEHPELAETLVQFATLLSQDVRPGEAETLLERAVAIQEKAFAPDHPKLMTSLVTLAQAYRQQDKYAEAESSFLRALPIQEKVLGADHIETATTRVRLGILSGLRRRFDEADEYVKGGIEIAARMLGKDHSLYGNFVHSLGEVTQWRGNLSAAAALFTEAEGIMTRALGPNNRQVIHQRIHLALVLIEQDRLDEAESLLRSSVSVDWTYDQAGCYDFLGRLYTKKGEYRRAEEAYQHSYQLYEKINYPTHLAICLIGLAKIHRQEGRLEEALTQLNKALELVERAVAPRSPRRADASYEQGLILQDLGRLTEALSAFQEALTIREFLYGRKDKLTLESREATIGVLDQLGRHQEAEQLKKSFGSTG